MRSIWLSQNIDLTGPKFGEAAQDFRRKGEQVNHSVGFGAQHDNGKRERPCLALLRKPLIHGQEQIEFAGAGDKAKEVSVADAGPAGLGNGLDLVAGKLTRQILRQTFVQEDAHSGGGEQTLAGFFEKGHGLLARYGGILLQKLVERFAAFDVIQQRSNGNTGAGKARFAAHDFRINHNDSILFHADNYTQVRGNDNPAIRHSA